MNKKYLEKIEFPKICEILSNYCKTYIGKAIALNLQPYSTEKEIIKALRGYLKDKMILYISHRNHSRLFQEVVDVGKSEV